MRPARLVSVEEYLRTVYQPDRDYVDGVLEERNWGERSHAEAQGETLFWLHSRRRQLGVHVVVEQRVQLGPSRFRVPDVCVVAGPKPKDQILRPPLLLVIEVLSPEDRMSRVQARIDDFLRAGVAYVWLIDPNTRRGWIYTSEGICEAKDNVLRTDNPRIELPLAAILFT